MREIKFQGKRLDNGEWVWGYYLETKMSGVYIVWTTNDAKKTRDGIAIGDKLNQCEVDPKTVGQYTGLKDKNGREIYEGDIVREKGPPPFTFDNIHVVVFRRGKFKLDKDETTGVSGNIIPKISEIIGNIYDNPELLEAQS